MEKLLRFLPAGLSRRLARGAVPLIVGIVLVVLLAGLALAALVSPGSLGLAAARVAQTHELPDAFQAAGLNAQDADKDGLPDALENYLYGTDSTSWNSSGMGIPDGWLAAHGYDPLSPATREARGAAPPADVLATLPAYRDGYPDAYRPTLAEYYAAGKPAAYQPGVDAPWWKDGAGPDPARWDQAGTGIPTGWLLHWGLDVLHTDPNRVAPGSLGNLTVREAFEHGTNPLALDSDADGLDDWTEIHATKTDPAKFSTAGTGIADGWLLHYGLNAFGADVASQDPDRDGLTNLEEFAYSYDALRASLNASGFNVLFTKGLDPTEWETARTGIPDGWYVKYSLSPFGEDVDRVLCKASDWPEVRDLATIPDFAMTIKDAYKYGRPSAWNESVEGVWWGGTNPASCDTDNDGIPDPVEIRGWNATVTLDTGADAKPKAYVAHSNPLEADSDADGLTDVEEYRGEAACGAPTPRSFPPTDPLNRDTAFSGLSDLEKVCGVVRGDAKYDLAKGASPSGFFLDPTKADSAGDLMKDGARVDFWHARYDAYRASPAYPYNGSVYRTLTDWTRLYHRFDGLTPSQVTEQMRPDGDVDGDGIPNALDADPSGGLYAEKHQGDAKTKVYFPGGPKMDPTLYRLTEFASPFPHVASDPANPDTDGDGLPDAWEIRSGTFDPSIVVDGESGGWNLDPSRADSNGDGVTDDKENLDGDVVVWYSYDAHGAAARTQHAFSYNVLDEFLAGTDPNKLSTTGDGVSDGWKAFWGSRIEPETFPSLLSAGDPRVGDTLLDNPARKAQVEAAMAASPIQPLAKLTCDASCKATGYVRFAVELTGSDRTSDRCAALKAATTLGADERADTTRCFEGENLTGVGVRILPVEGVWRMSYADEQRLRTNPYLADSDGDGAPDAYEAYMLQVGRARNPALSFPDPANPDGSRDPDADGLTLVDECRAANGQCGVHTIAWSDGKSYGAGADPNLADSDVDGIDDKVEAEAGLDALNPSDLEDFRSGSKDTDHDGIPDYLELTGWGKAVFGENVRTSSQSFDSDGDGLLDGDSLTLDSAVASNRTLMAQMNASGIAHRSVGGGRYVYLGERLTYAATGSRPDKLDSSGTGVPDSWYAYYHIDNPAQGTPPVDAYKADRPAWWDESRMGPWWWGRDPTASSTPSDADHDGLDDANGEDPFPALYANLVTASGATLDDPKGLEAFVLAGATSADVRARAQAAGDGAGDPQAARADLHGGLAPKAPVAFEGLVVGDGSGVVTKAVGFNVTGRLVLDGTSTGVANRTVLVSMFGPQAARVVGAGFTNATGGFAFQGNLTADQTVAIPAPGLTLLGATRGTVALRFDPSTVAAGAATTGVPNTLVVWAYNTSGPGATNFTASAPIPVSVHAATRFDKTVADTAENGAKLVGDVRLTDVGGGALEEPVTVTWTGAPTTVTLKGSTDRTGRLNLTNLNVPVSVTTPGEYILTARFDSSDPNLNSSRKDFAIVVRNPTTLEAALSAPGGTIGDVVAVNGTLATREVALFGGATLPAAPVGGALVKIQLGGLEQSATTDASGRFSASFPIPGSLTAGAQSVQVAFAGDDAAGPSALTLPLAVKRTAEVRDLASLEGPRSLEALLRGRLVDNTGEGIFGVVVAQTPKGILGRAQTDDEGAFAIRVPLGNLPLGTSTVEVAFGGDNEHGAATNLTTARVTSATKLALAPLPFSLVRGELLGLRATLVDDKGAPVAQQAIAVSWRGERQGTAVTDANGAIAFTVATNRTERASLADVGLVFAPRPNSIFQGSAAAGRVSVLQGSSLVLNPASVARGLVTATGSLLDDEGHPVAAAPVALRVANLDFGEARTARNGTFSLARVLPAGVGLGATNATASFAGTSVLAAANATAPWNVRSPLVVELRELAPLVRGEPAAIRLNVVDDKGAPVNATLHAMLANRDLGTLAVKAGKLDGTLALPADLPRGDATLWLNASATDKYDAYAKALAVVIKIRPKVDVHLPALAVRGFSVDGDLTLRDDQGNPLRNTTFAYAVGRGASPVLGQTDAEGKATLASVTPLTGDAVFAITVRGGSDVVSSEYRSQSVKIVGPGTPVAYASLILLIVALVVIVALLVAVALLRRRQLADAREILEEAIQELLAGNEYQGVVFLAYRRFSAHLARYGYAEKESQTPREFAAAVRKALPVGAGAMRELIRLFEEARYSDHAIGSDERDRAVESLASVRNEIDATLGRKGPIGGSA